MTLVGPWTCNHNGCLKHGYPALGNAVGHTCCGRCREGQACKTAAWGYAPLFEHPYEESPIRAGVCTTCKGGPH